MAPARAADGDGQVALPLGDELGEKVFEEIAEPGQELLRLGGTEDVFPHLAALARAVAEDVDIERVRQEPGVEDEVGVEGHSVLVAEAHDDDLEGRLAALDQTPGEQLLELGDVARGRVEDLVGHVLDRPEPPPLQADGLDDRSPPRHRMRPAALAEPLQEGLVGGVEKDEVRPDLLLDLLQSGRQVGQEPGSRMSTTSATLWISTCRLSQRSTKLGMSLAGRLSTQ